jgi:hypothetical protein
MRYLPYALALCALLTSAGCSRFSRDYRAALAEKRVPGSIDGAWQGTWSSAGGHHGELRCILTAVPGATEAAPVTQPVPPVKYLARFEATFWKVFTGRYTALLSGTREGDATHLSGDHDLGPFLGQYHYEATVTPDRFDATYRTHGDHGEFRLTRP